MVRCKMKLVEVRNFHYSQTSKLYVFTTEYDQSIPEDINFNKSSPNGRLEITIDNPAAQAQFELGKSYYFDASLVPAPAQPAQAAAAGAAQGGSSGSSPPSAGS